MKTLVNLIKKFIGMIQTLTNSLKTRVLVSSKTIVRCLVGFTVFIFFGGFIYLFYNVISNNMFYKISIGVVIFVLLSMLLIVKFTGLYFIHEIKNHIDDLVWVYNQTKNSTLILATYPFYKGKLPNKLTRCMHKISQKNIDKISENIKSKREVLSDDEGRNIFSFFWQSHSDFWGIVGFFILAFIIYYIFEGLKYYCIGITISFLGFYIKQNLLSHSSKYDNAGNITSPSPCGGGYFLMILIMDNMITLFVIFVVLMIGIYNLQDLIHESNYPVEILVNPPGENDNDLNSLLLTTPHKGRVSKLLIYNKGKYAQIKCSLLISPSTPQSRGGGRGGGGRNNSTLLSENKNIAPPLARFFFFLLPAKAAFSFCKSKSKRKKELKRGGKFKCQK